MSILSIPRDCRKIRPDGAPFDIGENLCVLYACVAMRACWIQGTALAVKYGKESNKLLGMEFPDYIWDAAVAAFAKHGNVVKP